MVPPGPIPNPEVKHQHVDGSRTIGPARVDSRQGSIEAPEPKGPGASSVSGVEHLNTGRVSEIWLAALTAVFLKGGT